MQKLDYIIPMLMGVLAFGNALWMLTFPHYDLAVVSFLLSGGCIIFARLEYERLNLPK